MTGKPKVVLKSVLQSTTKQHMEIKNDIYMYLIKDYSMI
jgi:hypothetical protein